MRKTKAILIVLLTTLVFGSCSTDKTLVSKGSKLDKYEYASIVQARNSFGTVNDIEIEPGIYDAVESTRLQMVGERRIQDLTEEQKEKLALVKYTATSNRFALTRQRDVDRAIKKLRSRITSIWK